MNPRTSTPLGLALSFAMLVPSAAAQNLELVDEQPAARLHEVVGSPGVVEAGVLSVRGRDAHGAPIVLRVDTTSVRVEPAPREDPAPAFFVRRASCGGRLWTLTADASGQRYTVHQGAEAPIWIAGPIVTRSGVSLSCAGARPMVAWLDQTTLVTIALSPRLERRVPLGWAGSVAWVAQAPDDLLVVTSAPDAPGALLRIVAGSIVLRREIERAASVSIAVAGDRLLVARLPPDQRSVELHSFSLPGLTPSTIATIPASEPGHDILAPQLWPLPSGAVVVALVEHWPGYFRGPGPQPLQHEEAGLYAWNPRDGHVGPRYPLETDGLDAAGVIGDRLVVVDDDWADSIEAHGTSRMSPARVRRFAVRP